MNFGQAIERMRRDTSVWMTRTVWNEGQLVFIQRPDKHSKMTLPYFCIRTVQGDLVPWLASHTDMFADDWVEVD